MAQTAQSGPGGRARKGPAAAPAPQLSQREQERRREEIYQGMRERLDEVIRERPEIVIALSTSTSKIDLANAALARAVNNYVRGVFTLRKEVRPYFDKCVEAYLELGEQIAAALRRAVAEELEACLRDHAELDISLESEEIDRAASDYVEAFNACLAGAGDGASLRRAFYRLIAAHLAAASDPDLETDPPDAGPDALPPPPHAGRPAPAGAPAAAA